MKRLSLSLWSTFSGKALKVGGRASRFKIRLPFILALQFSQCSKRQPHGGCLDKKAKKYWERPARTSWSPPSLRPRLRANSGSTIRKN